MKGWILSTLRKRGEVQKGADDRLYLPAIAPVSQSLNAHGLLYIGDCKMTALDTRAYLEAQ